MKQLLLSSCIQHKANDNKVKFIPKYKDGTLVCVDNYKLIIISKPYSKDDKYSLQLLDCKSDDCYFNVMESEINICKP